MIAPQAMTAQAEKLLSLRHVNKTFDGVAALQDVALDLHAGEVCGLVGPNGCGKSTLIKILAGVYRADPGAVVELAGGPGRESMVFVHQDLGLVATASIVENVALGTGYQTRLGYIRARAQRNATRNLLEQFGVRAKPDALVGDLSPANRALVAIARAFAVLQQHHGQGLLVLDEPTASLPVEDADRVLKALTEVAANKNAVLFVSHRLNEILRACSRIVVMRDGRIVQTCEAAGLTRTLLIQLMLGRAVDEVASASRRRPVTGNVLEVRELSAKRLQDVSLHARPGEIVGVTGLLGSGKSELARIIAGAQRGDAGEVIGTTEGAEIRIVSPRDARAAGIAFVPPDRRQQGAILSFTATENLTLPDLGRFSTRLILRRRAERREAATWMKRVGVRPAAPDKIFGTFSGGNQQKIVLAKWLRLEPRVLVLDEPTQAVDVGAVQDIYRLITDNAQRGLAVVLMSSEWEDLARICTRVYILEAGRLVAELQGAALTVDGIGAAALGHRAKNSSTRAMERAL